jgi:hypothetical protein
MRTLSVRDGSAQQIAGFVPESCQRRARDESGTAGGVRERFDDLGDVVAALERQPIENVGDRR